MQGARASLDRPEAATPVGADRRLPTLAQVMVAGADSIVAIEQEDTFWP